MKLIIEMSLDNAAFEEAGAEEVRRILESVASRIPGPLITTDSPIKLRDTNGNHVGEASIVTNLEATKTKRALDELARLVNKAQNFPNDYTNFEAMRAVIRLATVTA